MAGTIQTTLDEKTKKPKFINITMTVGESLNIPEIGIEGVDSKNLQFTPLSGHGIRVSKEGILTAESAGDAAFVIRQKNSKSTIQAWITMEEPKTEPETQDFEAAKAQEEALKAAADDPGENGTPIREIVSGRPIQRPRPGQLVRPPVVVEKPEVSEKPEAVEKPETDENPAAGAEPAEDILYDTAILNSNFQNYFERKSRLNIAITEETKQSLLDNCNIDDSSSFINSYLDETERQRILRVVNEDKKAALRMFRESVLSELPEMTVMFGYYAAYAGIRNARDLSKVSASRLKIVLRILMKTINYPLGSQLIMRPLLPDMVLNTKFQVQRQTIPERVIDTILEESRRLIPAINPHYYLTAPDDPEPTYLFADRISRTDGDIIKEGLAFLQNIELTLPLPRTISGTVKMKKLGQSDEAAEPKPGYLVQISGISSPAQDKVEDEEDLSGWTDSDGKFIIVMPDRYNLQETIKIVISENPNANYGVVAARTVADTVPKMTFIRRASEVMENDGIYVPGNKDGEYVFMPASEILQDITTLDRLYKENEKLKETFKTLILSEEWKKAKKQEILAKQHELYSKYAYVRKELMDYRDVLVREIRQRILSILNEEADSRQNQYKYWYDRLQDYYEINGQNYDGEDRERKPYAELKQEYNRSEDALKAVKEDIEKLNGDIDLTDESVIEHYHPYFTTEYIAGTTAIRAEAEKERIFEEVLLIQKDLQKTKNDILIVTRIMYRINKEADGFKNLVQEEKEEGFKPDAEFSDIVNKLDLLDDLTAAEEIYRELTALELEQDKLENEIKEAEEDESFKAYLAEHADDKDVQKYNENDAVIKEILEKLYFADPTTDNIAATLRNLLAMSFTSDLGDFILVRDLFDSSSLKPRALPSVRLMGEGSDAVFLPTDTAPSRIFNYSMVQRLVEPNFSNNIADGLNLKRSKLTGMIDAADFKRKIYEEPDKVPVATSLGMGYILNMHQAWVPDGFALGNLLYSLILAPGEEQRIIVQEHTQSYTVRDEGSALDTINDTYMNSQQDNEEAAFSNAADRYSAAHSDYEYYSKASSSGKAHLGLFFGIGAGTSATSTNKGHGSSNASQSDNYSEVSRAAQEFQTEIKTESSRIAAAQRTSIRTATSSETDSVSSRIIANHNHSHVMTVQYWEVARRYRMETCIEGVELVLFVPMKPVSFLPSAGKDADKEKFSQYNLTVDNIYGSLKKDKFEFRYMQLIRYADVLNAALPYKYRGGLSLIRKFAAYPEWKMESRTGAANQKLTVTVTGNILEFDEIDAVLYFSNSGASVRGVVTDRNYLSIDPSLNTREDVLFGLGKLRSGKLATKSPGKKDKAETSVAEATWTFEFSIPSHVSKDDVSHVRLSHSFASWQYKLSRESAYLTTDEKLAIANYEDKLIDLYKDDNKSGKDKRRIEHYEEGLPECYTDPIVSFTDAELSGLRPLELTVAVDGVQKQSASLRRNLAVIDLSDHIPVLRYNEVMKIEETFHHILSDTMHYSQVIWSSLSDDERIMLLEPYTVDMDYNLYSSFEKTGREPVTVPLLNCVNAKRVVGFYGNCMLLSFTYPQQLAEILGKTAGDVQEELYRYHTTNFRVPSTVISIPTQGMVGEAVLGATNVSEKIDITRFWNWKDSDIDHINLTQSGINSNNLLANATTKDINAPTQGAAATAHIDSSGLLKALTERAAPTFANALQNTDIRDLLKSTDQNASSGRDKVVESTSGVINKALDAAAQVASAYLGGKGGGNGNGNGGGNGGNGGGNGNSGGGNGGNGGNGGSGGNGGGSGGNGDGNGGSGTGGNSGNEEDTDSHLTGGGSTGTGGVKPSETGGQGRAGQESDDDPFGVRGMFNEGLRFYRQGGSAIDYFNQKMKEATGEDGNYQEGEMEAYLRDYCEANGADYDDIVASLADILAKKGE